MNKNKKFAIVSFIMFLIFLILYLTNNINSTDEVIYRFIMNLESDLATKCMKLITILGSIEFIIFIVFILLILSIFKGKVPIIIIYLITGESLINFIIKNIVKRERPNVLRLVFEDTYSFPSGHTMVSIVLYGFLIYLIIKSKLGNKIKIILSIILGLIPILVMISRIYLGVHFFSDVMAGMFLSITYLLLAIDIIEREKKL